MTEPVYRDTGTLATVRLTQWAAEQCELQRVGPLKVPMMVDAALYAEHNLPHLGPWTPAQIQRLCRMVEPSQPYNADGWRSVNVSIGGVIPLPHFERVPELMRELLDSQAEGNYGGEPDEFYRDFEEVHPWADGNGRVGCILWNLLRGALVYPYGKLEQPPDLWADTNRQALEAHLVR